jgi:hypothetical protein
MFQDRVREIILPLNGRHQSQGIKSDRDMRDNARTGSHRYQRAPRSAHTLDVVKCKEIKFYDLLDVLLLLFLGSAGVQCSAVVSLLFIRYPGTYEMCNVLDSHTSILSLFVVD